MMLKEVLIICLVIIAGCTTGYSVYEEEKNESNVTAESVNESAVQEKEDATKNLSAKEINHEKRLVAKGFGIFNYSVLTAENCDDFELTMIDKITGLRENIKDKEKNTQDEEDDVIAAKRVYDASLQRGDEREIERDRERLKDQEDEAREARDDLDEADKLLRRYEIILKEIQIECLALKAKET